MNYLNTKGECGCKKPEIEWHYLGGQFETKGATKPQQMNIVKYMEGVKAQSHFHAEAIREAYEKMQNNVPTIFREGARQFSAVLKCMEGY
jgi:hypothetical protein